MSKVFGWIFFMWGLSIVAAPLTRFIGRLFYEDDGDILWIAYLVYAVIVCSIFSFLFYLLTAMGVPTS